jgi:uncharacterized protein (TIGR02466 family)
MFEVTEVRDIFPTLLFVHQLAPEVYEPLNEKLVALLDRLIADAKLPAGSQLQTSSTFHRLPEARPLVDIIETAVGGVLGFMTVQHAGFAITGCWANVNPPGARHERHCHPNNFLSGVYYARVTEGSDTISFDDPRPHWTMMAPALREQRPELSNTVTLTVKTGTLVVFPSWLVHFVEPNLSNATRVSISFNAMFSSFAETISPTQWTPSLPLPGDAKG